MAESEVMRKCNTFDVMLELINESELTMSRESEFHILRTRSLKNST